MAPVDFSAGVIFCGLFPLEYFKIWKYSSLFEVLMG